jgi:hypothetical protein
MINRASQQKRKTISVITRSGRRLAWEGEALSESGPLPLEPGTALERECAAFIERVRRGAPDEDRTALAVHKVLARLD